MRGRSPFLRPPPASGPGGGSAPSLPGFLPPGFLQLRRICPAACGSILWLLSLRHGGGIRVFSTFCSSPNAQGAAPPHETGPAAHTALSSLFFPLWADQTFPARGAVSASGFLISSFVLTVTLHPDSPIHSLLFPHLGLSPKEGSNTLNADTVTSGRPLLLRPVVQHRTLPFLAGSASLCPGDTAWWLRLCACERSKSCLKGQFT